MALIKCPQCGQTVLSVASKCPKCGHLLLQARAQGDDKEFTHCRRCEKIIQRDAVSCEFCGYPQLARRRLRLVLGVAVAMGILAVAGVGIGRLTRSTEPPGQGTGRRGTQDSVSAQAVEAVPTAPVASPIDAQVAAEPAPEPPAQDTTSPAVDPNTRWAVNWANVREGPGTAFRVVGVLRPGTAVTTVSMQRGWWRISVDGAELGYVARDLLADEPLSPPN
jgi:hypothetical protein